ncbi:DUF3813 domain-containing protein [Bacillus gobiensis]|uniref:DUF3813 domain-containing protein n=1 Tax=Bacillus gobiensis TaxID=1441095 RepID=UPI003D2216EC
MRNELFDQAKDFVFHADQTASGKTTGDLTHAISAAKNAVSSAFANSTDAERAQLRKMQNHLDRLS